MARVYFHCSGVNEVIVDRHGSEIDHLGDAHDRALEVVHSFIATTGSEDWRDWIVHVSDDEGEELFVLPFARVIGRLH